jgi:NitT/TauT family transport system permease protein
VELRRKLPNRDYRVLSAISLGFFLLVWSILSYSGIIEPYFLPTPSVVLREAVVMFRQDNYTADILASLARVTIAFGLCALLAIPLGVLMGNFKPVEAVLNPFVVFMRYVPISAFIPLLILWAGIGNLQKIIFLWMGTFFYVLALISSATAAVGQEFLDTAYTLGASKQQALWRVIFPAALPGILDSLRAMMGVGWTYVVLAEIVGANSGIGYMIMESERFLRTPRVVVGIFTVGAIGIGLDYAFRGARRLFSPWLQHAIEVE